MDDYLKDREIQRKREYHRKWRAEHRDSVKAAQVRYWTKKAIEMNLTSSAAADSDQNSGGELTNDQPA